MSRKHSRKYQPKRRTNRTHPRDIRPRFLIVCEGKTEQLYFEAFRVPGDVIELGYNTNSLVQETIELRDEDGGYDQVWCVFDKDDFPLQNFNRAITLAQQHGIQVAYSNEAFELWYLLHFDYIDTAMSRHSYQQRLTNRLGFPYRKNDPKMYETLQDKQAVAIRNAENLLQSYGDRHNPANDNPCTTVHWLVKELNRFAR